MLFSPALLCGMALLLHSAASRAVTKRFTGTYYEVTNVHTHSPSNQSDNVTIEFTVRDPDPLTNSTTTCNGSWPLDSNAYPTGGYLPCTDVSFAWVFADNGFTNISSFTLQMEHSFKDPSMGPPPYDHVTTFAHTDIKPSNMDCVGAASGQTNCKFPGKETVEAPIWATIAKR
ncbi:hypothetical protein BJ546DRAFT_1058528 [Cryomyces antarcticus]